MRYVKFFAVCWFASLTVLMGAGSLMAEQPPDWSGTTADTRISFDDDSYASYIRIAIAGDNMIHLAWSEDNPRSSPDEIHYGQSTDGGSTWSCASTDTVISYDDNEAVNQSNDIVIDSYGYIFVVWSEDEPEPSGQNEILLTYSSDGGSTWSAVTAATDVVISDPQQDAASYYPGITVDPSDDLHVVYHKEDPAVGYAKIYTTRSIDGGATWTAISTGDQMINDATSPYDDHSADIACDSSGNLFVCYKKYLGTGAGTRMYITRSTDGGLTWSGTTAETPVSTVFNIASYPRIAVDANDIVHVIWEASDETASPYHYEIYHSRSTDGGLSWSGTSADLMISYEQPLGDSAHNAKIAADSHGHVCVVWDEEEETGTSNEILVSCSTDGGVTWSGSTSDELISFPDNEHGYRPDIASLANGRWIVVWSEFEGGAGAGNNYEIHLSIGDPLDPPQVPPGRWLEEIPDFGNEAQVEQ